MRDHLGAVVLIVRPGLAGRPLPKCLEDVRHSPDGFEWGYAGSGPAQLAFALLADATDKQTAHALYMRYKDLQIAALPHAGWTLSQGEIEEWVHDVQLNCEHAWGGLLNEMPSFARCYYCGITTNLATEEQP